MPLQTPKSLLAPGLGLALAAAALFSAPVVAQDVGVSISVGQPGFYGRIDLGDAPRPRLLYREPIYVERVREYEPIYLRVPPGHAKHWRKHCREYDACGRRVYFVRDDWYNNVYAPHYREQHVDGGDHGDRHDNDHGHGNDHGDGRDQNHDEGRGNEQGRGHGRGHDKGHRG